MRYKGITVFKQKNYSTWYARPRMNGKQYFISGKTQQECYNKLKKFFNSAKESTKFKIYNLNDWIKEWFTIYKQDLRERTKLDINYVINRLPNNMKSKNLQNFTTIEIKEFLDKQTSARTKLKYYTILNDIFDKAVKNKKIDTNPLTNISKPKYEAKEKYVLSSIEQEKLYNEIKKDKQLYILAFGLYQGLRPGELRALQYNDLDLNNNTVSITKSLDDRTFDTQTKNKYSNRIIPLFKETLELIKNFDTTSKDRITYLKTTQLNKKLQEITKEFTKEKITLYNLRHTFITNLENKNVPEHIIQTWCGHEKGSKVTKKTYTHVTKEEEIKYIDILNKE